MGGQKTNCKKTRKNEQISGKFCAFFVIILSANYQKTIKTSLRLNAAIPQVAAVHLKLVILQFAQIQRFGWVNILVGIIANHAERVAVNLLQTLNPQLVHLPEQVDARARIARSHLPEHGAAVGERGIHAVAFDAGAEAII